MSSQNKESGFTLLEVLIALAIFGAIAAVPMGVLTQARNNKTSELRSGALAAAQQRLDYLRLQDPTTLPTSGSATETITVGGKSYTVITTYCETAAYCATINNRHITVDVYREKKLYSVQTVFTQLK